MLLQADLPILETNMEISQLHKCTKCGQRKLPFEFYKDKRNKDKLQSECKVCHNEYILKWQVVHPDKVREKQKKWYAVNSEKVSVARKRLHAIHPERRKIVARRSKAKSRSTPKGNLSSTISKRMNESLQKGMKAGRHWETLVDFTIKQLRSHLEKQFTVGMSWGNYGEWHVDHRIPIRVFNFEKSGNIDFKKCWSLKNLQPMWAKKNISKGARLNHPFQPSLLI